MGEEATEVAALSGPRDALGPAQRDLDDVAPHAAEGRSHVARIVQSTAEYIERFYNLQRRHSHNGYVSPVEFEVRSLALRNAASFDRLPPNRCRPGS